MAKINSYTGEVCSSPTKIERTDDAFVIRAEDAVLDAVGLEAGQEVVLKGTIGDAELRIEKATDDDHREVTG